MLLILDNAEHVPVSTVGFVRALLAAAAGLTILVTSQIELIRRFGVHIRLKPLEVPVVGGTSLEDLRALPAVQLFEQTAANCRDEFELTDENAGLVQRILRVTDGLPFAIHLVASASFLTLQELERKLQDGLTSVEFADDADAPMGTRSAFHSVAWSYGLMSPQERDLLNGLAMFEGGWNREAVDGVLGGSCLSIAKPAELLERLRSRSLVERVEVDGRSRYRLLEPVREFALSQLRKADYCDSLAQCHLNYFLECVESLSALRDGSELEDACRRLTLDLNNLRAAFDYSLANKHFEKAVRFATGLARYFYTRGFIFEGYSWMERVISLSADVEPGLRRKAYHGVALIAYLRCDYEPAKRYWNLCLELSQVSKDEARILQDMGNVGLVAVALKDFPLAKSNFDHCLAGYRKLDNARGVARALGNLALVARGEKDYAAAKALYIESIAIFRDLNDIYNITLGLNNYGHILICAKEYLHAHSVLAEAINMSREQENDLNLAHSLSNYVALAFSQNDPERAAILMGAEEALRERISMPLPMESQTEYQQSRVRITSQLGHESFTALINVGRSTGIHQVCQYARSVRDVPFAHDMAGNPSSI